MFNKVRNEYPIVVSGAVQAFAQMFPKLDYLNLAVWESAQFLDGNEITLLRVSGSGGKERKCIGWKQELRGIGKLDVRLDMSTGGEGGGIAVNEDIVCNFVGL